MRGRSTGSCTYNRARASPPPQCTCTFAHHPPHTTHR
jgi:hypothetical protein